MTVTELVQLYAPLAGLLAVAFWLGVLTQRVRTLERNSDGMWGEGGIGERLVRMETKMESQTETMESVKRSMDGVQRQLGNMITRPPLTEFKPGG